MSEGRHVMIKRCSWHLCLANRHAHRGRVGKGLPVVEREFKVRCWWFKETSRENSVKTTLVPGEFAEEHHEIKAHREDVMPRSLIAYRCREGDISTPRIHTQWPGHALVGSLVRIGT